MIHLYCDGGLGNRLLSLFSGLYYAQQTPNPIIIHWPNNNWCGCNFTDLFDNSFNITNFNLKFINENVLSTCTLLVHEVQVPYKSNKIILNSSLNKDILKNIFQTEKDILYSGNSLHNSLTPTDIITTINQFKINDKILDRINNTNVEGCVGIHIRATDFPETPILTIAQIEELVKNTPDSKYFLCSDQKDIEVRLTSLYNNVIVFNKNNYVDKLDKTQNWIGKIVDGIDRISCFNVNRSKESVIEAFCDMILLSRTKLIKTSNSSFLKCAYILSKRN